MCLNFLHRVLSWYNISLTRQKIFVYFWGGRTKIHLVLGSRFPAACNEEAPVDLLYWIPPYCLANGLAWPSSGTKPGEPIIVFNYPTLVSTMVSALFTTNMSKSHCTNLSRKLQNNCHHQLQLQHHQHQPERAGWGRNNFLLLITGWTLGPMEGFAITITAMIQNGTSYYFV